MSHFKVLIIGGGSGGISVAARLVRGLPKDSVAVIEPSASHYYQPLWTLVGAGLRRMEETRKETSQIIPSGVTWIQEKVEKILPQEKTVSLKNGQKITFDYLVVASGLELNWAAVPGAKESLGQNGVFSIYEKDFAEGTFSALKSFKGGKALFVMPPVPIKCAGAPQKIMYLAEEIFREQGVRDQTEVLFLTPGKAMFGIPVFANKLAEVAQRKNIRANFFHKLIEVKGSEKKAVFQKLKEVSTDGKIEIVEDGKVELSFDFLHVVPPMKAHNFITESGLAFMDGAQKGWLKVNASSLQHLDYPFIFGVGDVTGVPNSKTGAAIRKQAPVVAENLLSAMQSQPLAAVYDGYSSCPLITQKGKVILAEFGYDSQLMPTFPLDPAVERYSMWILKVHFLPHLYWQGMLKGLA